jgi:hypothetical protein
MKMKLNFSEKVFLLALLTFTFYLSPFTCSAQVAINTSGANPDASAGLDVSFTNKGVLITRVALTQTTLASPVTSPLTSLMVYNTATVNDVTPGYYYWNGSRWVRIAGNGTCNTANFVLKSNGTDATCSQIFDNGTNVGIGTISPQEKLEVNGQIMLNTGVSDGARLVWRGGVSGTQEYRARVMTDGHLGFFPIESGQPGYIGEVLTLAQNGYVGIGLPSPLYKLHVFNGVIAQENSSGLQSVLINNDGGLELYRHASSTINPTCNGYIDFKNLTSDDYRFRVYWNYSLSSNTGGLVFASGTSGSPNTESARMSILNNGYVGIGTMAPSQQLDVQGNISASGDIWLGACGLWLCSGYISDIRFKKDITPMKEVLPDLMKLQPVKFNWRKDEFPNKHFDDRNNIGFIAQEMEKIYPEIVNTGNDGYKSIDYGKLTSVLTKAIQEQQAEIEKLKNANDLLSNKVDKLTNEITNLRENK